MKIHNMTMCSLFSTFSGLSDLSNQMKSNQVYYETTKIHRLKNYNYIA